MKTVSELKAYVLNYFSALSFNSEHHTYKCRDRALSSVSSVIHRFERYVDFVTIAKYVAIKETRLRGYPVTQEQILQEWEDNKNNSCDRGNRAHYFGEFYKKGIVPTTPLEEAIVKFWDTLPEHIVPFCFELRMYSSELSIAGTSDIFLYNTRTKKFIICDYKTNKDLFKNYKGKTLLSPFEFLLDTPFSKYTIQLSLYQYLFEQMGAGFEIEDRRIIWLKDDGTFEMFKTQDCREIIIKELTK